MRLLEMLDDAVDEPPPSMYRPGDRVAEKYTLLKRLGVGGMGEVWAARSNALDFKVAIKLIRRDHQSPTGQKRLLREARATAKLVEPGIVRVFDFGTTEHAEPFIVMEFLDGEDLASLIHEKRRLPATEAIRLLLPIVRALTVAHAAGIIHRDVKPENVFIAKTATGGVQPKLLDFGVAQLGWAERLTCSRSMVGSPEYMSPEQARGDDVDASTDTWALSVVLYEAITGASPFFGRNYHATTQNILTKEPTPLPDFGEGSAALWDIVKKGLHKDHRHRFKTSRGLGLELAGWLSDRGISDDIAGVSLAASWGNVTTLKVRSTRPDGLTTRGNGPLAAAWAALRSRPRGALLALLAASATALGLAHYSRSRSAERQEEPASAHATAEARGRNGPAPSSMLSPAAPHAAAPRKANAPAHEGEKPAVPQANVSAVRPDLQRRSPPRSATKHPSRAGAASASPAAHAHAEPSGADFRNPFE